MKIIITLDKQKYLESRFGDGIIADMFESLCRDVDADTTVDEEYE